MKSTLLAAALATAASAAFAAPETYVLNASHSQVLFDYNHFGMSTTYGMFSGFEGQITFDAENPAASSVTVTMPVQSMLTGWEPRFEHFMSPDFFGADDGDMVTFTSTGIEVTGDKTALITGDLTLNGVTKPVVLDANLNQIMAEYPAPPYQGKKAAGFDATATIIRSEFNLGMFTPYVSDEISLKISIEAIKAD